MEEEKTYPQYIKMIKKTEMLKKGGILQSYSSFWSPTSNDETYYFEPYEKPYLSTEHGNALFDKGYAVEVIKFDEQYLTPEQHAELTKALKDIQKRG